MTKPVLENNAKRGHTLLIWDSEDAPPAGDWSTVLWSSFGNSNDKSHISIPMLVEEQSDALRARYLAWIYELGEAHINGKRLVDHLALRPGFSYWWMTLMAQKFNASGTSEINNAIKAIAFEKIVLDLKPTSIVLVTGNSKLALTLQLFCKNLGVRFNWNFVKTTAKPEPIARRIYSSLPYCVQAGLFFARYLFKSIPLMGTARASRPVFKGEITLVDVLVHLDRKAFSTGRFISNYWTALVEKLFQANVKTNWLHNYFYQEPINTLALAHGLTRRFNKSSCEMQTHALIEANLSLPVFIKALKDYLRISWSCYHLRGISSNFTPAGSHLDLWPLFKHEWIESLKGPSAMFYCSCISLYEKTFHNIPYQKFGVYIQENQPWEMALIYTWKAAGHGKLISVPHTTVRFWDLRYFYDFRSYTETGKNALPIPDQVAVNGPVAKKAYIEGGYPESQLSEVEALRFLNILSNTPAYAIAKSPRKTLRILVCGDFLESTNHKILSWLTVAARSLPPETSYVFKPHPAYSIKFMELQSLALKITDAPLVELFAECDVVFTSNITSAAVDAYCSGLPVVQMLDGNTFNMSPLRGLTGVMYVTNPKELAEALINTRQHVRMAAEPYFYLDNKLSGWLKLLGIGIGPANADRIC